MRSKVHAMRLLNVKDADAPGYCQISACAWIKNSMIQSDSRGNAKHNRSVRGYPKIEWTKLREIEMKLGILFRYNHAMAMLSGVFDPGGDDVLNIGGNAQKRKSRHFW